MSEMLFWTDSIRIWIQGEIYHKPEANDILRQDKSRGLLSYTLFPVFAQYQVAEFGILFSVTDLTFF